MRNRALLPPLSSATALSNAPRHLVANSAATRSSGMDAVGGLNALDDELALMNSSDGGDIESLMCLLRSQVRQAGLHSISGPGVAVAALGEAVDDVHSATGSSVLHPTVVVAAPLNASGVKTESLEVCASPCTAFHASHFTTAGARAASCRRSRSGCRMRSNWLAGFQPAAAC